MTVSLIMAPDLPLESYNSFIFSWSVFQERHWNKHTLRHHLPETLPYFLNKSIGPMFINSNILILC